MSTTEDRVRAPEMTTEQAVLSLRQDPAFADLVRDAYLGHDVADSARRFAASGEFAEVRRLLGRKLAGATVLDLGAGVGVASYAFARCGPRRVIALEPDPSEELGRGAMARLATRGEFEILEGLGEALPLDDGSVDIVYCRQVLHHARDLDRLLRECARVLRPNGVLLVCREHVVDDDRQLVEFRAAHPVHRLAGGESAYSLAVYGQAITQSGLVLDRVMGPWESAINAFPSVGGQAELDSLLRSKLVRKVGPAGHLLARLPAVRRAVARRLDKHEPGRLYSFLAHRPR